MAKGDSNNEWSLPATEWFDQQIFGKTFTVQFAPHSTSGVLPCYSAHLYTAITKSVSEGWFPLGVDCISSVKTFFVSLFSFMRA